MNTLLMPSSIAPPVANYAHGVVVTAPTRWVHTAGVVPVASDGTVPEGVAAQAAVVWANIRAILAEAAMGVEDIVSVTTYVVSGQPLAAVMAVRDEVLAGRRVASTLVPVPSLAQPAWLVEIAVVAAAG